MSKSKNTLFRVRFQNREDQKPFEVVVRSVGPSDFLGMICLEEFVFQDQLKHVILPAEDEARKRFSKVDRIFIPYHSIIFIEEFQQEDPDLKNLPFIREIPQADQTPMLENA